MHNTTRRIATDAMLAAMFVCLSFVSIRIGNSMKISVDSLPILVAALLLGIGYPFAATLPTVLLRIVSGILIAIVFSMILPPILNALHKLTSGN